MSSTETRTRCVLLAPKGDLAHDHGEALSGLLDQRGWTAHNTDNPVTAMAELCLLDRTQASHNASQIQPAEQLALVVVEPRRWPMLDALLAAARRFVPHATLWAFGDGNLVRLPAGPEGDDAPPRPRLRTPRTPQQSSHAPTDPPQITREEIAMLLDDDTPEPSS